jgi:hypothetical protein
VLRGVGLLDFGIIMLKDSETMSKFLKEINTTKAFLQ